MIPIRTSAQSQEIPGLVVGLIIANVVVFLIQTALPPELAERFIYENALVPARYTRPELVQELGLDRGNLFPIVTNSFMHAGWVHLIVNMWTLWLFGRPVEDRLGALHFAVLYLACGAAASASHLAANPHSTIPALGASGAIAGVLGAFTLLHPRERVLLVTLAFFPFVYALPAAVYTALWFAFQVVSGVSDLFVSAPGPGIAWWAHIGGLVAGLGLAGLLSPARRRVREIGPSWQGAQVLGEFPARTRTIGTTRAPVSVVRRAAPLGRDVRTLRRSVIPASGTQPRDGSAGEEALDK